MNRQQYKRKYPKPKPLPPGMVHRRSPEGETKLYPAAEAQIASAIEMEEYDNLPRHMRDVIKERGYL